MLHLKRPWLVKKDLVEMVKKNDVDFETAFEALINDDDVIYTDDGEEVKLEFEYYYRDNFDEISSYDVTDFVTVEKGTHDEITLDWRKPK